MMLRSPSIYVLCFDTLQVDVIFDMSNFVDFIINRQFDFFSTQFQ